MKRNILYSATIVALALTLSLQVNAQVAINTTGAGPNSSAILDLTNTVSKGLLVPAVADVTTVSSPAQHLFMYQTGTNNQGVGLYYYEGSSWTRLASGGGTVTAVNAASPITTSGGSAPTIGINKASVSSNGYLAKADFIRFDAAANIAWTPGTGTNAYYNPGGTKGFISIGAAIAPNRLYVKDDGDDKFVAFFDNSGGTVASNGVVIKAGTNSTAGATYLSFLKFDDTEIGKIYQSGSNSIDLATSSDARLKNSIQNTHFSLENLMKIKVRDYYWNNDKANKLNTGFIAQELYEIFPNAVAVPAKPEGTWMISQEKLIPLIVKSIQDQQATMKAQEERIKSLEDRLSALEQKIGK